MVAVCLSLRAGHGWSGHGGRSLRDVLGGDGSGVLGFSLTSFRDGSQDPPWSPGREPPRDGRLTVSTVQISSMPTPSDRIRIWGFGFTELRIKGVSFGH